MSYGRDFGDELDDLREDLARLRQDAAALINSLIETGREGGGTLGRGIRRRAENWLADVQETLDDVKERGRDRLSDLTEQVGTKPLVAVLVAVGAGLAIAAMMNRRDRCA